MHDDELTKSLEKRLGDEADRLLDDAPSDSLIANLRATFVRQRRRRRLGKILAACAGVAVIGLIGTRWFQQPRVAIEEIATDSNQTTPSIVADTEQAAANDELVSWSAEDFEEFDPPQVGAVPVLLSQTGQDGEPEFAVGWYVPERVEAIDAASLAPAERSALSRLLGQDFDESNDETI